MSDLLTHLREHCRTPHEALHTHPLLLPLHEGPITLADYKAVLTAFAWAYALPEQEKPATALPDHPVMAWLENDRKALAVPHLPAPALQAIAFDSPSALVGYLYVKQGSALGGQMISRHLAEQLGIGPGTGNSFFSGEGKQTGIGWKRFKNEVLAHQEKLTWDVAAHNALLMFENIRICCDHMLAQRNEASPATDRRAT